MKWLLFPLALVLSGCAVQSAQITAGDCFLRGETVEAELKLADLLPVVSPLVRESASGDGPMTLIHYKSENCEVMLRR